jgi:hypothetical protein
VFVISWVSLLISLLMVEWILFKFLWVYFDWVILGFLSSRVEKFWRTEYVLKSWNCLVRAFWWKTRMGNIIVVFGLLIVIPVIQNKFMYFVKCITISILCSRVKDFSLYGPQPWKKSSQWTYYLLGIQPIPCYSVLKIGLLNDEGLRHL